MSNKISDIIGRTVFNVDQTEDEIYMIFSDGSLGRFYHDARDAAEVNIDDVNGDWADLIGHPLLVADERISESDTRHGSETWTFYTFRGIGGSVDVKWHGESDGYYSESVEFKLTEYDEIKRTIESLDS
tara:strand:- start:392 stop:778 length:387 start_codon:yes stop_codon:yes gene_type:complete